MSRAARTPTARFAGPPVSGGILRLSPVDADGPVGDPPLNGGRLPGRDPAGCPMPVVRYRPDRSLGEHELRCRRGRTVTPEADREDGDEEDDGGESDAPRRDRRPPTPTINRTFNPRRSLKFIGPLSAHLFTSASLSAGPGRASPAAGTAGTSRGERQGTFSPDAVRRLPGS